MGHVDDNAIYLVSDNRHRLLAREGITMINVFFFNLGNKHFNILAVENCSKPPLMYR